MQLKAQVKQDRQEAGWLGGMSCAPTHCLRVGLLVQHQQGPVSLSVLQVCSYQAVKSRVAREVPDLLKSLTPGRDRRLSQQRESWPRRQLSTSHLC